MERNCNLELRLVTPSVSYHSSHHHDAPLPLHSMSDLVGGTGKKEEKQLTIFYNGRVATCDVTELQARAIIMLARREVEEKQNKAPGSDPVDTGMHTGLSMKRSLQRFLQKRKTRAQSALFPYSTTRHHHRAQIYSSIF